LNIVIALPAASSKLSPLEKKKNTTKNGRQNKKMEHGLVVDKKGRKWRSHIDPSSKKKYFSAANDRSRVTWTDPSVKLAVQAVQAVQAESKEAKQVTTGFYGGDWLEHLYGQETDDDMDQLEIYGGLVSTPPAVFQKNALDCAIATSVLIVYIIYPSLVQMAFSVLECESVCGGDWLHRDQQERCWTGRHLDIVLLVSLPALFILVLILPGMSAWFFYKKRNKLYRSQRLTFRFGMLYSGYRSGCWYWELVTLLRKFTIILVITFGRNFGRQLHVALGALVIFWSWQIFGSPYPKTEDGTILHHVELESIAVLLTMTWVSVFFSVSECTPDDNSCWFVSVCLGVLILIINALFLINAFWFTAMKFNEKEKITKKMRRSVRTLADFVATVGRHNSEDDEKKKFGTGVRDGESAESAEFAADAGEVNLEDKDSDIEYHENKFFGKGKEKMVKKVGAGKVSGGARGGTAAASSATAYNTARSRTSRTNRSSRTGSSRASRASANTPRTSLKQKVPTNKKTPKQVTTHWDPKQQRHYYHDHASNDTWWDEDEDALPDVSKEQPAIASSSTNAARDVAATCTVQQGKSTLVL
jgi:hypothetical protein